MAATANSSFETRHSSLIIPAFNVSNLLAIELKRSKYRLLGLVGQGQFGRVYCASHRKTGRLLALKELDRSRFPTHQFLRELRFLLSLQHPNIVTCHALEHTQTRRYLVMDYCEGGTLRNLIEEDVRLHPAYCLKLIADVLAGLEHAHSRGIVHCDIKPENILLTVQSTGWTPRISDFGIARVCQGMAKEEGSNTGSPAYMAPERFYGQYSYASDLYSIGILLFELLVGYRPFSGAPSELMSAHLNQPVKIPETLPLPLRSVISTALQKLQARRFRSAAEMLSAVQMAANQLAQEPLEEWASSLLLRPASALTTCECHSLRQEVLQTEIQQLLAVPQATRSRSVLERVSSSEREPALLSQPSQTSAPEQLFRVFDSRIGCQVFPHGMLSSPGVEPASPVLSTTVRLAEPIQTLVVRPQGYFAITQRSIYALSSEVFQPGTDQDERNHLPQSANHPVHWSQPVVPQLITEFSHDFHATIDPQGHWMATAVLEPDSVHSTLQIWKFTHLPSSLQVNPVSLSAHHPVWLSHLFQLSALDGRHLAAFSHQVDSLTQACIMGVGLQVFTRRGNLIGSFRLPLPLRSVATSYTPYQLLALEPGHPNSLLLIDLKPLRVQRVGLEIAPVQMATTSWGCVLMATDGRIVLLNHYGQRIGQINGPMHPTAISVLEPYGLLIATWDGEQGCLYTIDLRALDLEFVF